MVSPQCEEAIKESLSRGAALLKFLSPNDVGATESHQAGFYLPKASWTYLTTQAPEKGVNHTHPVEILWPDGTTTKSSVIWYGKAKSEYRLTGFNRDVDFPWRTPDNLGSLLVLVPKRIDFFLAYVLDSDEDIEEIQASLGVQVLESWGLYEEDQKVQETEDECLRKKYAEFAREIEQLPKGEVFSEFARLSIFECFEKFQQQSLDDQLIRLVREEYNLFKLVERKVYGPKVVQLFKSIDDFLSLALVILNSRKSRAGRSLENHVAFLLRESGLKFDSRPAVDGTEPDILIPGAKQYVDPAFPSDKLFILAIKTTCKDRWRQVTEEAPRIPRKHILTLQEGISANQLNQMQRANVHLVVPESLHGAYPEHERHLIQTIESFVKQVKAGYNT